MRETNKRRRPGFMIDDDDVLIHDLNLLSFLCGNSLATRKFCPREKVVKLYLDSHHHNSPTKSSSRRILSC